MLSKAREIRLAIISDDVKTLEKLLYTKDLFRLRFGRFPFLSLAYLYGANKVIRRYEVVLKGITDYIEIEEDFEDYVSFKKKAGKSLRYYVNGQIVSPVEMAVIVDDSEGARTLINKHTDVERISKLYKLTHDVTPKKKGNSIVVPRSKKPNFIELMAVLLIVALSVVFIGGGIVAMEIVPQALGGDGTEVSPMKINSESLLALAFEDSATRYYHLEKDLTIDVETWQTTENKAHIDGGGNTITLKGNLTRPFLEKLSGSIKNVTFKFETEIGEIPQNSALLIKTISGTMENLTVDVSDIDALVKTECGLVGYESTGIMRGISVNASGKLEEVSALEETVIGTLLYKNVGVVENVSVKINFELLGDARKATSENTAGSFGDAIFGGIVGLNNGQLINSKVEEGSTIKADTLDVGGIVATNQEKATISNTINYANVTQTTLTSFWSPNVGGITMRNYGKINSTKNYGNIVASSNQNKNNTSLILGGITTTNTGVIDKVENYGNISATVKAGTINAGGVGYLNEGTTTNAKNFGTITTLSTDFIDNPTLSNSQKIVEHHVGGAYGINNGTITKFRNDGNISSNHYLTDSACIGGVVGLNYNTSSMVSNSQMRGNISASSAKEKNKMLFVGGIVGYLMGVVKDSFNIGAFSTEGNETALSVGAIFGTTRVESDLMGDLYKSGSDWANNYYLIDKGYQRGIGYYYVTSFLGTTNYMEAEDYETNASTIETITSNEGVYWE